MIATHRSSARRRRSRSGFTIAEMLVYMVISSVVLMSTYRMMMRQGRGYAQQLASTDADETARGAAGLLAWELRQSGVANDGLQVLGAHSIALRSVQGVGVVCGKHATLARYGIWKQGGDIQGTADDSAMLYVPAAQRWRKLKIAAVGTPSGFGVTACDWAGRTPDLVVEVTVTSPSDTLGIKAGSLLRAFRKVRYSEFTDGGRWWLGRKVGGATTWEKLTGPLLDSAANGLTFTYQTASGATAGTASSVGVVQVLIRSESSKKYRKNGGVPAYRQDSVTTKVALRK
jgi:hypothetical protein